MTRLSIFQRILAELACLTEGHAYEVAQKFDASNRRVICRRCRGDWAMNDHERCLLGWDSDFEELYRTLGHEISDPWRPSPSGLLSSPAPATAGLDSPIRTQDTGARDYLNPVSVGCGEEGKGSAPAPSGASACPHGVPHRWNCEQCDHP
jgi:hypothetical protein